MTATQGTVVILLGLMPVVAWACLAAKRGIPLIALGAVSCIASYSPLMVDLTGLPLAGLLFGAIGLVHLLGRRSIRFARPRSYHATLAGLIAWMLATVAFSGAQLHLAVAYSTILLVLLFPLSVDSDDVAPVALSILGGMVVGGVMNSLAIGFQLAGSRSLFGVLSGLPASYEFGLIARFTGLHINPNAAAYHLLLAASGGLALALGASSRARSAAVASATVIAAGAAVLTGSRAAVLSLIVVLIIGAVAGGLHSLRWVLGLAMISVPLGVIFLDVPVGLRLADRSALFSNEDRLERWGEAWDVLAEEPVAGLTTRTGVGTGNVHSDLLQAAVVNGIPAAFGVLLVVGVILVILLRAWRSAMGSGQDEAVFAGAVLCLSGAVLYSLSHNSLSSGLGVWLAISFAARAATANQRTPMSELAA